MKSMNSFNNIIIRMPNWLGDFVLATSILEDLRKKFKTAKITCLAPYPLTSLLEKNPFVDEVIIFKKPKRWNLRKHFKLIHSLKEKNFDLGILLTNSFSSAFYFYAANIPTRVGYTKHLRSFFLTNKVKELSKKEHQIQKYKRLLLNLKIPLSITNPQIIVDPKVEEHSQKQLSKFGFSKKNNLLLIHVGAKYGEAKCYPLQRYKNVIEKILKHFPDTFIAIIGDDSQKNLIKNILDFSHPRLIDLLGKTSLQELIALINLSNVLLTNDSGPMHLAAALQKPLVALFGSTDPKQTGPYPKGKVIYKKVSCSPCFLRKCPKDFRCMKKISEEEVFKALKKYL